MMIPCTRYSCLLSSIKERQAGFSSLLCPDQVLYVSHLLVIDFQAQKNTESTKIFEAKDAIKTLREGEKSKSKKIQELETIIMSERQTARKAEKERERMEKELKALQVCSHI